MNHLACSVILSALLVFFAGVSGQQELLLSRDQQPFHDMMSNDIIEVSTPAQPATPSGPFGPATPTAKPAAGSANKTEPGFIDSIMGEGMQSRIASSVTGWVTNKVKSNPGCMERFMCESYKTGQGMSGLPYVVMQLTNAAVGFTMAQTFDGTINVQDLIRASLRGHDGECEMYKCDMMDGQLRTVGDFLGSLEEFVTSIFNSVSNSFNIGRK